MAESAAAGIRSGSGPDPLMKRALALIGTKEACKLGLGSDPSLLLLLVVDPHVLDTQIPVGRALLNTLESLNVR